MKSAQRLLVTLRSEAIWEPGKDFQSILHLIIFCIAVQLPLMIRNYTMYIIPLESYPVAVSCLLIRSLYHI